MSKKKKIILISVLVTVALVMGVGGLAFANMPPFPFPHEDVGGHKLIGVGEMGHESYMAQEQWWDTQFIVTNPNCEKPLEIQWVALIVGDDAYWQAEQVLFEGTPDDWYYWRDIDIPGNDFSDRGVLSPHEVWQVSIAELIAGIYDRDPESVVEDCDLGKYTLEVTWRGAYYWWYRWGRVRPLIGWQKEKCWYVYYYPDDGPMGLPGMAMSEAEMKLFPSRMRFSPPEWWEPGWWKG